MFAPGLLTLGLFLGPWPWSSFKKSAADAEREARRAVCRRVCAGVAVERVPWG